jgi:hypothetical protein
VPDEAEERRRYQEEQRLKAAWREGFTASRQWPNHSLPVLVVEWDHETAKLVPQWKNGLPGYIG